MGYSIYIGNAVFGEVDNYERCPDTEYHIDVEHVEHDTAPEWPSDDCWPDVSGKSNGRHPGYSQMDYFAKQAGLYDLWFADDEGLLSQHPGVFVLRKEHLQEVRRAKGAWEQKHPNVVPGWNDGQCGVYARLIWYEYWMDWALNNCEHPAVKNS